MRGRKTPIAVKKKQGTFKPARDSAKEFVTVSGIILVTPQPPEKFTEKMIDEWNIVWKHLIDHEYGKASDVMLVELYVRSLFRAIKAIKEDDMLDFQKAFQAFNKCSEMLGLNPSAMAKVAILQNKSKTRTLDDLLDGTGT